MANISGPGFIGEIDLYTTTTTVPSGYSVGQLLFGPNGKYYRFGQVGAVALVMGNMLQGSAIDTTYTNMVVGTAVTAANVTSGQDFIQITNGTATITSEQFLGGSLSIYTAGTIAIGDEYTILGVSGTLTTGGALTVQLDRPLRAAVTTSATVNMRRSPFSGVLQSIASTLTASCAGRAMTAAAASTATVSQYTFFQTHGVGSVLSDGTSILVGSPVAVPSATAGAVILGAAGLANVGQAMQAAASGKGIAVFLQVD